MDLVAAFRQATKGQKQKDIAKALGVTVPLVSMILSGYRQPSDEMARRIMRAYPSTKRAATAYLLGREAPDPTDKSEDAA